jgi:hypothetical protein
VLPVIHSYYEIKQGEIGGVYGTFGRKEICGRNTLSLPEGKSPLR